VSNAITAVDRDKSRKGILPWCFPVGLALLPLIVLYANKGTVPLLLLCATGAAFDRLLFDRGRWSVSWQGGVIFVAVLAWGLLTMLWEETPGLAVNKFGQLAALGSVGFLLHYGIADFSSKERRRGIVAATGGIVVAMLLVVVDSQLRGKASETLAGLVGFDDFVYSAAKLKAACSLSSVLAGPIALWLWRAGQRWMAIGLAATIGLAAVLASSNTSVLALVVGLVAVGFGEWRPRLGASLAAGLLCLAFGVAPLAVGALPPPMDMARSTPWLPNSLFHRFAIWKFTAERIAERPILGWGLDASRELPGGTDRVDVPIFPEPGVIQAMQTQALPLHPHNMMLQLWLELGGLGGILVICGLAWAILKECSTRAGGGHLAVFCAALVVAAASFGAWQSWWLSCVWLALGLARVARDDT